MTSGPWRPASWNLGAVSLALALALVGPAVAAGQEAGVLRLPDALWAGASGRVTAETRVRAGLRSVKYAPTLAEAPLPLPRDPAPWPSGGAGRAVELAETDAGIDIHAFNEARLDFLTVTPSNPGRLAFVAELAGPDGRAVFVSDPLESVTHLGPEWAEGPGRDAVAVAGGEWREKNVAYVLARLLNRPPDDVWRYTQDGPSTFLQRRFDRDLSDVGAIDVVLTRGQDVQVNLVVALGASRGAVLDWYALEKARFDLGDGRTILRLYLGRYLRKHHPGSPARLREMAFMFFRENQAEVVRNRTVQKVIFAPSGLDAALLTGETAPRHLPARVREPFAGRGELAANLEPLNAAPFAGMRLERLRVVQSPQEPNRPFAQELEAARLALTAPHRDVSAVLAAAAERCKTFGAACDIFAEHGLVSQAPLWSLDFAALAGPGVRDDAERLFLAGQESLFNADGPLAFSPAPDGLTVEAPAGRLVLETGLAFVPEPGRAVTLWLDLGRRRAGLAGVEAEVRGQGVVRRYPVKPGFPARLDGLPARVDGVRLVFALQGPEPALTLRQAVIQSLGAEQGGRDLFTARYLFDRAMSLNPAQSPTGGLALSGRGPALSPQWLLLNVRTTPWTTRDTPASLVLDLGGRHSRVPLPSAECRLAVYLPGLPGADALAGPEPILGLTLTGGAPGAILECPSARLTGQELATWPEILAREPLVSLDGRDLTLSGLTPDQARRMAASNHWLPLGPVDLPAGTAPARLPRSPWIEVEALLLDRTSGPELTSLAVGPENAARSARALPWKAMVSGLGTAVGLWIACRRGRLGQALRAAEFWLARERAPDGAPLPLRGWLLAGLLLAAAGFLAGLGAGRQILMASALLALPVWRALRLRLADRFPFRLANTPALQYLAGFLLAVAVALPLRLARLTALSELLGLAGLGLFLAAVFLHLRGSSKG